MAVLPARQIGTRGIITDVSPFDLGITAWSDGRNVTFKKGRAERSPVFKIVNTLTGLPAMTAIVPFKAHLDSVDQLYAFAVDGSSYRLVPNGTALNLDPADTTLAHSDNKYTVCALADVLYVNRSDLGMRCLLPDAAQFVPVPNIGTTPWTCDVLRSYQDFLVALSVTKSGVSYRNMVKWSNAALAGQAPSDWDATQNDENKSTLAGENLLAEMDGPIIDGMSLKNDFLIYGRGEVWAMEFTGAGDYPFIFRKLFSSGGSIGPNCAVEVDGCHYVFGATTLYRHDGVTIEPLQGVSDYVFRNKANTAFDPAFVTHDPRNQCVLFCYQSNKAIGSYCDTAAVYDYIGGTWSFVDLPNVSSMYFGLSGNYTTWADGPGTLWSDDTPTSHTWADDAGYYKPTLLAASNKTGDTRQNYILAYDRRSGGVFEGQAPDELNPPAWLERTGIAIGPAEMPEMPVNMVKQLRRVYPLCNSTLNKPLAITLGGQMNATSPMVWGRPTTFDPVTQYQIDTRVNGRFLAFRIECPAGADFDCSGFDLDVISGGRR